MARFLILIVCIGLISCQKEKAELKPNEYLAHLQLDSTSVMVTKVADQLEIPWEITFGKDGWLWFTEQKGSVSRLNPETGEKKVLLQIKDLDYEKSRGLLGMALHPNLLKEPFVYLFYNFSWSEADEKQQINSRLVRYTWKNDSLVSPKIVLDSIPGKRYHNGARLIITPDEKLLVTLGDAGNKNGSQDTTLISGKILRMNLDGSVPDDNPFPNSLIYSMGHRNAQGLVLAEGKYLISSEHGTSNDDELNLILPGRNYGWPLVEGYCDTEREKEFCILENIVEPLTVWSPTLAPAGIDFYTGTAISEWENSIVLTSLKGQAFVVLKMSENLDAVVSEKVYLHKSFGRLRDVAISPSGEVYLSTSNKDWHPSMYSWLYDSIPPNGDMILKLQRIEGELQTKNDGDNKILREVPRANLFEKSDTEVTMETGESLYSNYCKACHLVSGVGIPGAIPPLAKTDWVTGDKLRLIDVLLNGLSIPIEVEGKTYDQEMPAFANLSDKELADLLSYIRSSFGNEASKVTADEVSEERHR